MNGDSLAIRTVHTTVLCFVGDFKRKGESFLLKLYCATFLQVLM